MKRYVNLCGSLFAVYFPQTILDSKDNEGIININTADLFNTLNITILNDLIWSILTPLKLLAKRTPLKRSEIRHVDVYYDKMKLNRQM